MGSFKATIVEPMEVFSIPLQKRAVHLVLVHNHPSGTLKPSEADKDITDRLIQVGRIMKVPILDHLIITESSYYSFANSGLLDELSKSLKYVPAFEIKKRYEKQAEKKGKEKGNRERKKENVEKQKKWQE
jgi:DNA repair protein RadC